MTTNIIYSFFLQLQVLFKVTLLVFFFILEISSQNARLGQSLSEFEEFPYVVRIFSYSKLGDLPDRVCTGALLSLQHVLIPDRCVSNVTLEVYVTAGSVFEYAAEYTQKRLGGQLNSDIIKHVYVPSGNIAILELPNEFNEERAVTSILIPTEFQPNPNERGYYIVGFPFSYPRKDGAFNNPEACLMKTGINVNNRTYCGEHLPTDTELELCTGVIAGGVGACDTFGAILIKKGAPLSDELYGILHDDCCGAPRCFDTFYDLTNPAIREWIEEVIDQSGSETPTFFEATTDDTTTNN